ncbi:MAG: Rpn family recombination-promoting nuclease/putative transposase [Eubacteriales bacterium]|nr:Rpn family recombination-promoting nuclease/putative transposase [Eubacteriales bacterium]
MSQITSMSPNSILQKLSGPLRFPFTNAYLFVAVLQKNHEALCQLIAVLLHIRREEIISVEILNLIVLGQALDKKDCVLDLLILLNDNTYINLEMQVRNEGNWDDRSIYYLAQKLCDLESGKDYRSLKRIFQIGILDFNFPDGNKEFYQQYALMNRKTHRIYSDKIALNVLCLSQLENASEDDRVSGLYKWAKIFKATTWEEMKALTQNDKVLQETVVTLAELSEDEKIRQQCRRWEKYERDRISAINYGKEQGIQLITALNEKLTALGRQNELLSALSDKAMLDKLLQEFKLQEEKSNYQS